MSDDQPIEKKETSVSKNSRQHFKYRSNKCLNCSHPLDLSDRYCPYCSQLNTTKSLSLSDFFGEFFNSVVSFDSRLRYTLKDLLLRPGVITKNYIKGQRLKYANPFRFFLSVSIIYFLLFFFVDSFSDNNQQIKINQNEIKKNTGAFQFNLDNNKTTDSIDEETKAFLENIDDSGSLFASLLKRGGTYAPEKDVNKKGVIKRSIKKIMIFSNFRHATNIKDAQTGLDSLKYESSSYNRWLYNKGESAKKITEDPYSFIAFLMKKVPFFLFFFTPFYTFFFWLVYSKKKYTYMEHMIFIFHIFSFSFLALIIALIPDTIFGINLFSGILFAFVGPFYFYKALRNFYRQSHLLTIIKFVFLNTVFFAGASFIAAFFFAFTAAMY